MVGGGRERSGGRKGIEEGERNPRRDLGKYYCNYTLRFISCVSAPRRADTIIRRGSLIKIIIRALNRGGPSGSNVRPSRSPGPQVPQPFTNRECAYKTPSPEGRTTLVLSITSYYQIYNKLIVWLRSLLNFLSSFPFRCFYNRRDRMEKNLSRLSFDVYDDRYNITRRSGYGDAYCVSKFNRAVPLYVCVGIKFPLAKYRWKHMCVTNPSLPLCTCHYQVAFQVACHFYPPPFVSYPNPYLRVRFPLLPNRQLSSLSRLVSLNSSAQFRTSDRNKKRVIKTISGRGEIPSREVSPSPPLHGRAP